MNSKTKQTLWMCAWFLAGSYFAVAAVGGSYSAAAMTLLSGYIAGRKL